MKDNDYDIVALQQKFEAFFIRYFPKVRNFAKILLKSDFVAEDMAQDVFVKLWQTPEVWVDTSESLDSLLYTITRNRIFDYIKHKNIEHVYREAIFEKKVLDDILSQNTPIDNLYYKEARLLMLFTLEQMPEKRRTVFTMNRFDGMKNEEIAKRLNLSVRTVEHHIYLALAELKKILLAAFFFNFL